MWRASVYWGTGKVSTCTFDTFDAMDAWAWGMLCEIERNGWYAVVMEQGAL